MGKILQPNQCSLIIHRHHSSLRIILISGTFIIISVAKDVCDILYLDIVRFKRTLVHICEDTCGKGIVLCSSFGVCLCFTYVHLKWPSRVQTSLDEEFQHLLS